MPVTHQYLMCNSKGKDVLLPKYNHQSQETNIPPLLLACCWSHLCFFSCPNRMIYSKNIQFKDLFLVLVSLQSPSALNLSHSWPLWASYLIKYPQFGYVLCFLMIWFRLCICGGNVPESRKWQCILFILSYQVVCDFNLFHYWSCLLWLLDWSVSVRLLHYWLTQFSL